MRRLPLDGYGTDAANGAFVSGTCTGERCSMCGKPATRKVGEEIPFDDSHPNRHNLTAYVCDEHFNAIFSPRRATGPTVRVRIAVAVDANGSWTANGWLDGPDNAVIAECISHVGRRPAVCWIEADVPLPLAPQTIRGQVSDGNA